MSSMPQTSRRPVSDDYYNRSRSLPDPSDPLRRLHDAHWDDLDEIHREQTLMEDKCRGAMDDARYRQRLRQGWFPGDSHAKP